MASSAEFGRRSVVARIPLAMGSHLCVLKYPGRRDVRSLVHITRNRSWAGVVKMRTDSLFDIRPAIRVLRGGGWSGHVTNLRRANRLSYEDCYRSNGNGFRPARSVAP